MEELVKRNKKRMQLENYQDATPWFAMQLDDYEQLKKSGLIDVVIDGSQTIEILAEQIVSFT